MDRKSVEILYFAFIRSKLEYADVLFIDAYKKDLEKFDKIERQAKIIISGGTFTCSNTLLSNEFSWHNLNERREIHTL